jgi:hypothetical protein
MKARIVYESPSGVFIPGQNICGSVIIELTEHVLIRSIMLFVVGKSHTNWECFSHYFKYAFKLCFMSSFEKHGPRHTKNPKS